MIHIRVNVKYKSTFEKPLLTNMHTGLRNEICSYYDIIIFRKAKHLQYVFTSPLSPLLKIKGNTTLCCQIIFIDVLVRNALQTVSFPPLTEESDNTDFEKGNTNLRPMSGTVPTMANFTRTSFNTNEGGTGSFEYQTKGI